MDLISKRLTDINELKKQVRQTVQTVRFNEVDTQKSFEAMRTTLSENKKQMNEISKHV